MRKKRGSRSRDAASAREPFQSPSTEELTSLLACMATDPDQGQPAEEMSLVSAHLSSAVFSTTSGLQTSVQALKDPILRTQLLRLLAFAVREVTTRRHPSWCHWRNSFVVLVRMLRNVLTHPKPPAAVVSLQLDLTRLLVCMDFLPCLSRLLASLPDSIPSRTAPEALLLEDKGVFHSAVNLVGGLLDRLSGPHGSAFARQGLRKALRSSRVLEFTARVMVRRMSSSPPAPAPTSTDAGSAAAGGAAGPTRSTSDDGPSGLCCPAGEGGVPTTFCRVVLTCELRVLAMAVHFLTLCRLAPNDRESRWAVDMLSGPCIQHVMLLHLITQLCAADGGPRYGLPAEVDPPVVYMSPRSAGLAAGEGHSGPHVQPGFLGGSGNDDDATMEAGSDAAGGADGEGLPGQPGFLETAAVTNILEAWIYALTGKGGRRPPLSDRAIREVCGRVASAANDVMEQELRRRGRLPPTPQVAAAAAPAAHAGGNIAGHQRLGRLHPDHCGFLATRSLVCALTTCADYRGVPQLWPRIVRTVRNLLELPQCFPQVLEREDLNSQLLELMRPRFPPLPQGGTFPQDVPPAVSAAVASGYIPCLEKLLRRSNRAPGISIVAQGMEAITAHFAPFASIGGLLIHGEPRTVAGLLVTGAKLLRRAASAFARVPELSLPAIVDHLDLLSALKLSPPAADWIWQLGTWWEAVVKTWEDGQDGPGVLWWTQQPSGEQDVPGDPAAGPLSFASGSPAGAAGPPAASTAAATALNGTVPAAAQPASSSAAAVAAAAAGAAAAAAGAPSRCFSSPATRLLTLSTLAFAQWLPAVARAALTSFTACHDVRLVRAIKARGTAPNSKAKDTELDVASHLVEIIFGCTPTLIGAWAVCAERAAATGDPDMARGAASWRQLLLDMDLLGIIRCRLVQLAERGPIGGEQSSQTLSLIAELALPLFAEMAVFLAAPLFAGMAVFEAPPLPASPALPAQLGDCTALEALWVVLGDDLCCRNAPTLDSLEACASGQRRAMNPVNALATLEAGLVNEMPVAKRLPPPCVAAAAVGLPLCGNVHCEGLAGDGEAGLGLSKCAGRCGGSVAYCSRDCQMAHWKACHKKECGKKG